MKQFPLAVRDDGFTALYSITPPCTPEKLCRKCVDHLAEVAQIREIGTGVGFAMNFRTRRGDLMGEDLMGWGVPEDVLSRICEHPDSYEHVQAVCDYFQETYRKNKRLGDFRALANIHYLLQRGTSPFKVLADRSHELNLRVWARFELRGGLPSCFANHREYQIPGRSDLDFRHEAVRALLLDLAEDMVSEGADGISLDFCVYPPFFEKPDTDGHYMTQLLRDMRMHFAKLGRKIDLVARLPYQPEQYGLLWRDWVKEEVIDVLIPSVILPGELFDVPNDGYVEATRGTSCRVFGCMRPKMTSVDPDPQVTDEKRGIWRFNRPNTRENDAARAALLIASGVDGIQIGLGTAFSYDRTRIPGTNPYTDAWQPYFEAYAQPESIRFANKTYPLVNARILPYSLKPSEGSLRIPFRIADDLSGASGKGLRVSASVCPIMRALEADERLTLSINGSAPVVVDTKTLSGDMRPPIVFNHDRVVVSATNTFCDGWWLKGRKEIPVDPTCLKQGDNLIEVSYAGEVSLDLVDVDIEIRYVCAYPAGNLKGILDVLAPYTGNNIEAHLTGARKEAFRLNRMQMKANYGNNVDGALLDRQILLCDATAKALYDDAWNQIRYIPGSRPELEKTVHAITAGISSKTNQVIAIMNFCRDLYQKNGGRILFYGGTEEELIKKGEQLCECSARLMVSLCEIAGIPARIITHVAAGHLTCEACTDYGWGYFDPRTGFYCVKPDGEPASFLELLRNPHLLDIQPDEVKSNVSPRWSWEARATRCRELFLNPYEINTVKPYSLADHDLYEFGWTTNRELDREHISSINRAYVAASNRTFGIILATSEPRLVLTLPEGAVLNKPVPVLAVPQGLTVPPRSVCFFIDQEAVWTTLETISPSDVHLCVEGAFQLFGIQGMLDPARLSEGPHTLSVCDSFDESIRGQVSFIVPDR